MRLSETSQAVQSMHSTHQTLVGDWLQALHDRQPTQKPLRERFEAGEQFALDQPWAFTGFASSSP